MHISIAEERIVNEVVHRDQSKTASLYTYLTSKIYDNCWGERHRYTGPV